MTDALGRATRFEHDERGLVTAVVRPDGSRETRAYDEAGRLVERVDANGDVTTIGHDDLGRVLSRTTDEGTTTDRESVGRGKSGSVRVDLGGRRYIKKKQKKTTLTL